MLSLTALFAVLAQTVFAQTADEIAEKSLKIAGTVCIYTNVQITLEEL